MTIFKNNLNCSININISTINKVAKKAYFTPAALVFIVLNGCTTIAVKNPVDPWESWNRSVSSFNDTLDTGIVKPIATVYTAVFPQFVRTGVTNFFSNLTGVWTVVNSTLQLKPKTALDTFFRVTVNTFLGVGGLVDVASDMNIERHTADFGQTLGHYGVPPGPYLVLPFLGSSTLRDTLASTIISRGDLVWQLNSVAARNSLYALRLLDIRANLLRTSSILEAVALDKYSFTRDIYLQVRRNDILDGKEPPEDPSEAPEFKEKATPDEKSKLEPEKKSEIRPDINPDLLHENNASTEMVVNGAGVNEVTPALMQSDTIVVGSLTQLTQRTKLTQEPNAVLDIKPLLPSVPTISESKVDSDLK
jgi:phospholipid-binding lipoprotein MlaA